MTNTDPRIARASHEFAADSALQKPILRARLLAHRSALPALVRCAATAALCEHLIEWQKHCGCTTLAVFWPVRGEPDLMPAYLALAASGVQFALPVVTAAEVPLNFVAWVPGQTMQVAAFGVPIPALPGRLVTPQGVLVPCLGFNWAGYRLGYGGGFYDRTLRVLPDAITAGIGFDCGRVAFHAESHDIALQSMITESGIV